MKITRSLPSNSTQATTKAAKKTPSLAKHVRAQSPTSKLTDREVSSGCTLSSAAKAATVGRSYFASAKRPSR